MTKPRCIIPVKSPFRLVIHLYPLLSTAPFMARYPTPNTRRGGVSDVLVDEAPCLRCPSRRTGTINPHVCRFSRVAGAREVLERLRA